MEVFHAAVRAGLLYSRAGQGNKREEGTRHHTSTCGRGQGEDLGPN